MRIEEKRIVQMNSVINKRGVLHFMSRKALVTSATSILAYDYKQHLLNSCGNDEKSREEIQKQEDLYREALEREIYEELFKAENGIKGFLIKKRIIKEQIKIDHRHLGVIQGALKACGSDCKAEELISDRVRINIDFEKLLYVKRVCK